MTKEIPLLSITIPTWNRAAFLKMTLEQLASQLSELLVDIEILVSDNASTDNTSEIIAEFLQRQIPITYVRNSENIGSDRNIAQCFNLAKGHYVLILGDDDLLVDGSLQRLVHLLSEHTYGTVAFRAYGYDIDFRTEKPLSSDRLFAFTNPNDYFLKLGVHSTLISCNIIAKSYLPGCDANQFCGSNLVQTELILKAAFNASINLYIDSYLVACKRNNSGGYSFFDVFVDKYFSILDKNRSYGLSISTINTIGRNMLIGFYPYYAWKQRVANDHDIDDSHRILAERFGNNWQFYVFIWPISRLPKLFAICFGGVLVAVGRIVNGDLRRGLQFFFSGLVYKLSSFLRIH